MLSPKTIAEEYASQIWQHHNLAIIDTLVSKNIVIHSSIGEFHGSDALKNVVQIWLTAFPDLQVTNELVIAENDLVCIQWRAQGTHKGDFKGHSPSEKQVSYRGATIYRIHNHKITEYWTYLDNHHLINQIQ